MQLLEFHISNRVGTSNAYNETSLQGLLEQTYWKIPGHYAGPG